MRYLLPLIASSAFVAAAPQIKTVTDVVMVTVTQYVEESAPTGDAPAVPYFPAPAAPAPYVASAPAPVPVVVPSSAPVAAPVAPPVVPPVAPAAPSKPVDAPKPADTPTSAAASKPTDISTSGSKDGQTAQGTQGQANTASTQSPAKSDSVLGKMAAAEVMSIVKTCWNGAIPWPIPNTPLPCVDVVAPQLSLYARPATKPNMLTVNNYCGYDIHFDHFNGPSSAGSGVWKAHSSNDNALTGTVYKIGKTANIQSPVLVEYGVGGGQIYYDLSLINCVNNGDTSNCAGHEAGLQIGGPNAKTFQCAAGAWCDDQMYFYQENLCKKQNPVSATASSNGLAIDFCASQKK